MSPRTKLNIYVSMQKWRRFDQGKLRIRWPFWQSYCNVLPVATMVQDQTIRDGLHTKMSPR